MNFQLDEPVNPIVSEIEIEILNWFDNQQLSNGYIIGNQILNCVFIN